MSLTAKLTALGLILLAIAAGVWKVLHDADRRGYARAQAEYTEARLLADRAQRTEEQRRAAAVTKESTDAAIRISELEADLRSARSGSDRLRDAANATAVRARARSCSAIGSSSEPGEDPIGLLADVLGRADQRAGDLAEYADRLRIAGIACERSYDALTPKQ